MVLGLCLREDSRRQAAAAADGSRRVHKGISGNQSRQETELERCDHHAGKLFISKGVPEHIRSDNGPEFTAKAVRGWLEGLGVKTLFIEPGSPWENGYIESFNGKLRDELLNGEIFYTVKEAEVLVEMWRKEYNQVRPHSSPGGTSRPLRRRLRRLRSRR